MVSEGQKYELWSLTVNGKNAKVEVENKIGFDNLIDLIIYYDEDTNLVENIYEKSNLSFLFRIFSFNTENERREALELYHLYFTESETQDKYIHVIEGKSRSEIKNRISARKNNIIEEAFRQCNLYVKTLDKTSEKFIDDVTCWFVDYRIHNGEIVTSFFDDDDVCLIIERYLDRISQSENH
jgi:hypothetical protein